MSQSKKYKLAILIGRFEPFHNGHFSNFLQAEKIAEQVAILVGSSFQPRTPKNPFTFSERSEIIQRVLSPRENFRTLPIPDFKYSNNQWIAEVQSLIAAEYPAIEDCDICIMGYEKDDTSWYNRAFPEWKFIELNGYVKHGTHPIDATKIRELYFEGHLDYLLGAVPARVLDYLSDWQKTDLYKAVEEEYVFYRDYHKKWESAPYVPTFQTTDAVIVQGGHILLIQRAHAPGKGLWALPGGFVNPKERLEDGMIRELIEETRIKVPEIVLKKAITCSMRFDHPDRDLRGRVITEAFLIELTGGDGTLPKVKPASDARRAEWFKLSKIREMGEQLYSDHQHIIQTMIARAEH